MKFSPPPPPPKPPPWKKKICSGIPGSVRLRCPLTVRLTGGLREVIDWVVLGPPRTLSAALEVRGHLFCKSASYCTVAIPGEQCHVTTPPPLFFPPQSLLPLIFTLGRWGEASIKPFLPFASLLSIF